MAKEQDIIFVLEHIKKHPNGKMGDLDKLNKKNVIEELKTLGILKSGHTIDEPTYAVTTFGQSYIANVLQRQR